MVSAFFKSFFKVFAAFGKISRYGLWVHLMATGVLGGGLGYTLFSLGKLYKNEAAEWIVDIYPFSWGTTYLEFASGYISAIVLITLGIILYKYIIMAICSPIMSFVSEKVEEYHTGYSTNNFSVFRLLSELWRGVVLSLSNISKELLILIAAFIGSLLVPVLSPVIGILVFIVQSYFVGFSCIDYYFERKYNVQESKDLAFQNKWGIVGIGAAFIPISFIPIFGWIFAPILSCIAATEYAIDRRI